MRAFRILLLAPTAATLLVGCSGVSRESTDATAAENTVEATTTTAATHEDNPGYIDCIQAPEVKPTSISLDCTSDADQVVNIHWEVWNAEEAIGTGIRERVSTGTTTETAVLITLSNPIPVTLGWAFSERDVEIDTSVTNSTRNSSTAASSSSSLNSSSSSASPSSANRG